MNNKLNSLEIKNKKIEYGINIIDIQEKDRKRIARELHDTSLQNLAFLVHKIELCNLLIESDPNKAKLELAITNQMLRKVIDEIRNTVFDLRPMTFDDLGFKASINRLIDKINENKKYRIESNIDDVSCETNLVLVTIYRIIQECLINIDKHAEASCIKVECKNDNDKCIILIEDNGKGFSEKERQKENHYGLMLIEERTELVNGKISINSNIGEGTRINIEIPLF